MGRIIMSKDNNGREYYGKDIVSENNNWKEYYKKR